ncbi:MAG: bifunctional UDP-N-acetylglucosamine diphosphorylase/glucosamine-1-phosphate N-acetyltransferase GlmU [Gammaproteobacteria bacterium]|nr:bifunctional UDP-N-acetylglucosamine diphosphorylase/glucosamine-1-phosphate N-acetyltransferase GlmU [Gammaproteobacteria bacterium]
MDNLEVIILAAGAGTRMRSQLPKVLQPLAGRPLLAHVLATAKSLTPKRIHLVYGHAGDAVKAAFAKENLNWIEQIELRGTGDAVKQALPHTTSGSQLLILYGDVPLTRQETLEALLGHRDNSAIALLSVALENPSGYGRIVRNSRNAVTAIVEEKDASAEIKTITEINSGILTLKQSDATLWVNQLDNRNAQGEYYLTDIIAMAVNTGQKVTAVKITDANEVAGVNTRQQLAALERSYQLRQAEQLMQQGVTLIDPSRLDIRGEVSVGNDTIIDVNVILSGNVSIGNHGRIGANTIIHNSTLGNGVTVEAMSQIDGSNIADECTIGPFARLRPGSELAPHARIGNFVEIKASQIGEGSKVNHLSYIGDTTMGERVNIGAGTITCNYDGAYKHRTTIGNDAFIGSDTQLIAPVNVGDGATIGAGSTISKDASAGGLTLSRASQKHIANWQRPQKREAE